MHLMFTSVRMSLHFPKKRDESVVASAANSFSAMSNRVNPRLDEMNDAKPTVGVG
jgi:hypothetical protein